MCNEDARAKRILYFYRDLMHTGCVDVRSAVREFSVEFTLLCNSVPRDVSHPFSFCPTTMHDEEAGRNSIILATLSVSSFPIINTCLVSFSL